MTRDEQYLALIKSLVGYTRELSDMVSMAPTTRREVRLMLNRVEQIAKGI